MAKLHHTETDTTIQVFNCTISQIDKQVDEWRDKIDGLLSIRKSITDMAQEIPQRGNQLLDAIARVDADPHGASAAVEAAISPDNAHAKAA